MRFYLCSKLLAVNQVQLAEFTGLSLAGLVHKLDRDFYGVITKICKETSENTASIEELEVHQSNSQYLLSCKKLMSKVCQYVKTLYEYFIPYFNELDEKVKTNHDCLNCSGRCHFNHETKLAEFSNAHNNIKDVLYRLQMLSLPLHLDTTHPEAYKTLRNQIAILENTINDLFFLEEAVLIPKIIVAQKNIHVRS